MIESPTLFSKVLSQWILSKNGCDKEWVLSDSGQVIEFVKKVNIIIDPYAIDINHRKIISKLYEIVQQNINHSQMLIEWRMLQNHICDFSRQIIDNVDYSLEINEEIEIKEILKIIDLKFGTEYQTLGEKILDYILLAHQVLKLDVFIFVNLRMYLESEELNLLAQKLMYEKIHLLLLEGFDRQEKFTNEKVVIVDKDYCVIYK